MEEEFRFDDDSYEAFQRKAVAWQEVVDVLHRGGRQFRRHIGAVLMIAGKASTDTWIGIVAIEEDDNMYLVVGAQQLTPAEIANIEPKLEGR